MNSKKKIAQGYVFLKPFNGIYLPTYIQNILIKNCCDQKNFQFNLSINEHNIKNCWMELFSLVKKKNIEVIIMTSIYMLPNNKKDFTKFCDYLKKNRKEFFFIFENKSVVNLNDLKKIVKNYNLYKKLNKFI
jgi:sporadic carbohydrate cluster protein (TIGR04323 family)